MSIEFEPPSWAPYAIPSAQGWRHPVTKELLVAIPGGVKTKPGIINESPEAKSVIKEEVKAEKVIDEVVAQPVEVIKEAPAVKTVITEAKVPAKRGPKPKAK